MLPPGNFSIHCMLVPTYLGATRDQPRSTQRVRHMHANVRCASLAGNALHRVSVAAAIGYVTIRSVKHPAIVEADVAGCEGLRHHVKSACLDVTETAAVHEKHPLSLWKFATTEQRSSTSSL
jgi:hypothetical protein